MNICAVDKLGKIIYTENIASNKNMIKVFIFNKYFKFFKLKIKIKRQLESISICLFTNLYIIFIYNVLIEYSSGN
jgi:hypothetical protein